MVIHKPRPLSAGLVEHAEQLVLCVLCVLCVLFSSPAFAVPPVRTMYTAAVSREQAVRPALAAPDAAPAVLVDVHEVVAAYVAIVKRYPASGYSDNALWQAGRLALDAFSRFGRAQDKATGLQLLRRLAAAYPTSKLAKLVPDEIARLDATGGHTSPPQQPTTTDPRPATGGYAGPPLHAAAAVGADPGVGPAAAKSTLATIRGIRRAVLPDAVRITIELDSEVPFHEERITDPARVFVDLPGTRAAPALIDRTLRFEGDADIVRQVRIGRHPNNVTRVVLDAGGVTSYSVYPLYSPYRLVIDCVRLPAAAAAVSMTNKVLARVPPTPTQPAPPDAAPLTARNPTATWLRRLPAMSPRAAALLAAAAAMPPEATPRTPDVAPPIAPAPKATEVVPVGPASTPAPSAPQSIEGATAPRQRAELPAATPSSARQRARSATAPPAPNATGGLSIARQLGLGVSRIVIDPGHGGHDPGAKGKGFDEAELVLDVALRLEKLLQKIPGVEVILTRRTDEFIQLPERTAIANREGADLFLSIHANASTSAQAHGVETYFLNFANNQSAAAVAARENAASTQAMGGLPDFVRAIAQNNKLDESRDFALHVQRAMVERQKAANRTLKDLGVKQAPFVVLIGANMPSVLAEMGFVTNPQEARMLKASAYRQRIAESLFNAIRKYQTSLKNVSTVAHQ